MKLKHCLFFHGILNMPKRTGNFYEGRIQRWIHMTNHCAVYKNTDCTLKQEVKIKNEDDTAGPHSPGSDRNAF